MTQYVGTHRPEEDQSHTGHLDCESLGDIHVSRNGTAIVQFWVTEGFLEEEPSSLHLTLTTHQRKRLIADLNKEDTHEGMAATPVPSSRTHRPAR